MLIKSLLDEDFVNYKKPAMFIAFPFCTFKCERECGIMCCQNSPLVKQPNIEVSPDSIVDRYLSNPISKSVVFGGLEPFDSWEDLQYLVKQFREKTQDDIVIYTGYNKEELIEQLVWLQNFTNIIIKFGRFIPNDTGRFDDILGITLASKNQYAEVLCGNV